MTELARIIKESDEVIVDVHNYIQETFASLNGHTIKIEDEEGVKEEILCEKTQESFVQFGELLIDLVEFTIEEED